MTHDPKATQTSGTENETAASFPDFQDAEYVGYVLYSTALYLKKRFLRVLAAAGHEITPEQYALLHQLWQEDGLYQSELAERTYKDRHSMARMVKGLVQKGLVERRPDDRDERLLRCHLTEAGRALRDPLLALHARHLEESFRGLGEKELEAMQQALLRLRKNLEDDLF